MFQLSAYVVGKKLSGQVLHRRSGVLSASVRAIPSTITPSKIIAGVEAGSGPAGMYAGVHEFGGSRAYEIMSVKKRALRFFVDGKAVYARKVTHQPAGIRAYMSPSLTENAGKIQTDLQAALDAAIAEE